MRDDCLEQGSQNLRVAFATPTSELSPEAERFALSMQFSALDACRQMKHELSNTSRAKVTAEIGMPREVVTMSREVFDTLVMPLVQRTVRCCDELVSRAGKSWHEVDDVILVGGSSRMPLIAEALKPFGPRIRSVADPELAVSLGAALYSEAMRAESSANRSTLRVVNQESGPYRTIQSAIDAAAAGDTIHVYPGTFEESLRIEKDVDLIGRTTLDTDSTERVIVHSSGTVPALTVRSARSRVAGITLSVDRDAALKLESCVATVEGCHIVGRISADSGAPTIKRNYVWGQVDVFGGSNALVIENSLSGKGKDQNSAPSIALSSVFDRTARFVVAGLTAIPVVPSCVRISDSKTRTTIERNILCGYEASAIYIGPSAGAVIAHNVFQCGTNAIEVDNASVTLRSNRSVNVDKANVSPTSLIGVCSVARKKNSSKSSESLNKETTQVWIESHNESGEVASLVIDSTQSLV